MLDLYEGTVLTLGENWGSGAICEVKSGVPRNMKHMKRVLLSTSVPLAAYSLTSASARINPKSGEWNERH